MIDLFLYFYVLLFNCLLSIKEMKKEIIFRESNNMKLFSHDLPSYSYTGSPF